MGKNKTTLRGQGCRFVWGRSASGGFELTIFGEYLAEELIKAQGKPEVKRSAGWEKVVIWTIFSKQIAGKLLTNLSKFEEIAVGSAPIRIEMSGRSTGFDLELSKKEETNKGVSRIMVMLRYGWDSFDILPSEIERLSQALQRHFGIAVTQ